MIGRDDRQQVTNTTASPWRMICSLVINGPKGTALGTGFLVGRRIVLTAGHCIFDDALGGWATSIVVVPGRNGDESPPFGSFAALNIDALPEWLESQDPDFDIGCIELAEPVGNETGWFAVAAPGDAELQGQRVNVAGYPQDLGDGQMLFRHAERIAAVRANRLFHVADTERGTSGAPIWLQGSGSGQQATAVAVHTYGDAERPEGVTTPSNSGTRITKAVLQQIATWRDATA